MKIIAAGNACCGDDGVGAAVLDEIRRNETLPGVDLVDIRCDALALLDHLVAGEKTIIIDAARMGLQPGAVAAFPADEVRLRVRGDNLSLHGLGLAEALALARELDRLPGELLIVGVEPERLGVDEGLSEIVRGALPRVLAIIAAEVRSDA